MNKEESKPRNDGLATASLTLGILATVLGVVGIGVILGILAIVFGALSIKDNKGKSLTGIITGAVGIILFVVALIFVLVVLPNATDDLQSSQRDTQRKNDVSVLLSDVTYRMSEDRGKTPEWDYVNEMTYKLAVIKSVVNGEEGTKPTTEKAVYTKGTDCDGNDGARKYSLTILLENGTKYCQGS